jgi:hypothetical protein
VGNTEMSVVIDSPALCQSLARLRSGNGQYATMYKLRLQPDGQTIEWLYYDDQGRPAATTEEPGSSTWLRFKLWLQSLLVAERLL